MTGYNPVLCCFFKKLGFSFITNNHQQKKNPHDKSYIDEKHTLMMLNSLALFQFLPAIIFFFLQY